MARRASYDDMMAELELDGIPDSKSRSHEHSYESSHRHVDHKLNPPREERNGQTLWHSKSVLIDDDAQRRGVSESSSASSDQSDTDRNARIENKEIGQSRSSTTSRDASTNLGTSTVVSAAAEYRIEINALREFLTRAPKRGATPIQCFVERDRQGLNRLHPVYRLFHSDGKQFLMCAQKRAQSKTANYLLTMEKNPSLSRRDAHIVGKLRSNWSGSQYLVYDDGLSPNKTALDTNIRYLLGSIEFSYDESGPGRLMVRVPRVQSNGQSEKHHDCKNTDIGSTEEEKSTSDGWLLLRNKQPHFDAKSGGHVLDFGGRVTMPSVKNFQLHCDDEADTVLQFGRVSCQPRSQCKCHKNTFNMDVQYPLNPLQAFAICLSTLDTKFTDTKLYDSVTKFMLKKR